MSKSTKTSSTTDQTTHNTITPNNPAWVDSGLANIGGQIAGLSNLDPYSLIAGPDPLQTQAGANASNLTGTPWDYAASNDLATSVGQANAPDIASLMNNFKNPWQKQVVDTTLAGFDQNAGYSRANDMLAKAGDTTFGGSGGAIQTALNEQNIAQGRASTQAQLESQGFNTALTGATSQAGVNQQQQAQRLAAAGLISQNANDYGANQRANIGTQMNAGQILQQQAQQRAGAPVSLLGTQASLMAGLPLGLLHGQTDDGTMHGTSNSTQTISDPMGSIGTGLMGAAALFGAPFTGGASLGLMGALGGGAATAGGLGSLGAAGLAALSDRRLKNYVKKVGEMANGIAVYSFRYLWSPVQHLGVMAQDVLAVKPEAVISLPNGYMAVNYGAL